MQRAAQLWQVVQIICRTKTAGIRPGRTGGGTEQPTTNTRHRPPGVTTKNTPSSELTARTSEARLPPGEGHHSILSGCHSAPRSATDVTSDDPGFHLSSVWSSLQENNSPALLHATAVTASVCRTWLAPAAGPSWRFSRMPLRMPPDRPPPSLRRYKVLTTQGGIRTHAMAAARSWSVVADAGAPFAMRAPKPQTREWQFLVGQGGQHEPYH